MNPSNCTGETELRTWIRFLATHSAITRELEARLMGAHGLTLSDYDVLVQLAQAPDRKLRNIDLAKAVVLTRSGVTRLVDG
ncbi:MAG: MarR family transcriptional regulator, partial [Gaiellaceae bacterium]